MGVFVEDVGNGDSDTVRSGGFAAVSRGENGHERGFLWLDEGVFMGAKGCLLEKVTGGFLKNHLWKFLKPLVTFLKTTGGFILRALESYQRKAGNEPSLLGDATNLKGWRGNFF